MKKVLLFALLIAFSLAIPGEAYASNMRNRFTNPSSTPPPDPGDPLAGASGEAGLRNAASGAVDSDLVNEDLKEADRRQAAEARLQIYNEMAQYAADMHGNETYLNIMKEVTENEGASPEEVQEKIPAPGIIAGTSFQLASADDLAEMKYGELFGREWGETQEAAAEEERMRYQSSLY